MPEPRETLAYRAPPGQRVTLAPLALPELRATLVARVIPDLPGPLELPARPVLLEVPDQLAQLGLRVLAARPEPLVAAC